MSVAMAKSEGVTVFTVTSDPNSSCPPICQILKSLCYSPVCCSVSQRLRMFHTGSQSAVGALQILVGLIHIGLGAILCASGGGSSYAMDVTMFPYWLGGLFILFGVTCILSEKYPSPCLVISNVMLNLAGVAFAITAIVLYSINIAEIRLYWLCDRENDYWYRSRTTVAPSPDEKYLMERCMDGKAIILMLLRGINAVLIIMSALQLCLTISSAVLGIKALKKNKSVNKIPKDGEICKPLLDDFTDNPTV
ncbi:membrane-spanning 4-domains subfamily A member 15-like [Genypterus blacodes]|uniref:membrane-spanning 4-domains subfamily A member 15-like n=1 Tax=Genypterus blacodes TaxID=154954 RepID=UPI003F75F535